MRTRTHTIRLADAARRRVEEEADRRAATGRTRSVAATIVDLMLERLDDLDRKACR